jgi:hypothetical protein
MRARFLIGALSGVLLVLSAALFALYFGGPSLARRVGLLAEARPPQRTITASLAFDASIIVTLSPPVPPGTPMVREQDRYRQERTTFIEIVYRTPIDVNDTADIQARLSQEERRRPLHPPPGSAAAYGLPTSDTDPSLPHPVQRLDWAITLHLDGAGLEWGQQDIPIKTGTPLAVTEHWTPRPKGDPGDFVLRFPLKDVNHAAEAKSYSVSDEVKVNVNGVQSFLHGSDDLTLPISITKYGLSARGNDWLFLVGAIITGASAVFGAAWGTKFLSWLFGRKKKGP